MSCCCIAGVQFLRPRDERSYSGAVCRVCPVPSRPLDSAHCNASDCPVEASPSSPPLPLACLPSHVSSVSPRPCLVLMVRFNFRTWANHDRRPRTAPPSGTQYSTLDGWGNGKSCVAPLLCRADASFAGARGLAQRAILGHGIHVTLYRSHRLLSVPLYCLSLYVSVRAHQLCTGFLGLLALCQPPLKKTGLCAGPRLPRISPSRRGGIFLPVGRLARNKCPRVSGYAVSSRRCVGSSVFVCLFVCLLACLLGSGGVPHHEQRVLGAIPGPLLRIPPGPHPIIGRRLSCAVPSLTSRQLGKGAASHQQLDKEMALLVDLQRDGRLWRIRLPGPWGSKRKHL